MRADVCDSDQMKSAFAETINSFGCFDILFNNAGITTPQPGFTRVADFHRRKVLGPSKSARNVLRAKWPSSQVLAEESVDAKPC
jgi:NAD(P)-dependent dehydrogenase (short-subunit alcohol dehydrogenase family)